jgi:hypothetical protein
MTRQVAIAGEQDDRRLTGKALEVTNEVGLIIVATV